MISTYKQMELVLEDRLSDLSPAHRTRFELQALTVFTLSSDQDHFEITLIEVALDRLRDCAEESELLLTACTGAGEELRDDQGGQDGSRLVARWLERDACESLTGRTGSRPIGSMVGRMREPCEGEAVWKRAGDKARKGGCTSEVAAALRGGRQIELVAE